MLRDGPAAHSPVQTGARLRRASRTQSRRQNPVLRSRPTSLPSSAPQLVALEGREVPVLVRLRADVAEPDGERIAARAHHLPRAHPVPDAPTDDDELPGPTLSTAEPKTSSSRPCRGTTARPNGAAWSRSGSGEASASSEAARASTRLIYTAGAALVRVAVLVRAGVVDVHGQRRETVAEGVVDRADLAALAEDGQRPAVQQRLVHRRVERVVGRVDRDHVEGAAPVPGDEEQLALVARRGQVRHVGRRAEAGDVAGDRVDRARRSDRPVRRARSRGRARRRRSPSTTPRGRRRA